MKGANDEGGEEEADVDELEDGDESGAEEFDEESDDEPEPPTILKGALTEYETEGANNLLYSGTWSFSLDDSESSKFKLTCPLGGKFDFKKPAEEYTMTGYFIMKDGEGAKMKVQEEDVKVKFMEQEKHAGKRWTVSAVGTNQFGTFTLKGEYRCKGEPDSNKMNCEKAYEKKAKAASDSEDEDFDAAPADEEELQGLEDDANLSVEELRAKYAGGGEEPDAKRSKTE